MRLKTFVLCAICTIIPAFWLHAEPLTLAKIFSDHMIFQQQTSASVWGWAEPNAKVVVKPSWDNHKYSTKTNNKGEWRVAINTPTYGGPYSLKISSGKESVELKDVLIGEVWVCSGQSNMEMAVEGFVRFNQPCDESVETCIDAINYGDKIRIFTVPKNTSDDAPAKDLPSGAWQRASFSSCASCSAIAYHFAHYVNNATNIPIGVVVAAWGGTGIRPWTPRDCFENQLNELVKAGLMSESEALRRLGYTRPYKGRPTCVGTLYNGMIAPIKGFAARGFLWYQGCNNKADYKFYDKLQTAMVARWRAEWGDNQAKMPFYYVLIAPFLRHNKQNNFARGYFVENQALAAKSTPNSDFASTECYGSKTCIHPAQKKPVSRQLALLALSKTYGFEDINAGTPTIVETRLEKGKYIVECAPGKGLKVPPGESVNGFEVAGDDRIFYPATARLAKDKIIVTVPQEVKNPQSLRYSFYDYSEGNVRSSLDFPLAPFRTDNWELQK